MQNKLKAIAAVAAVMTLAACGTTSRPGDYECPLRETSGSCASVDAAYGASQKVTAKNVGGAQSVFEVRATAATAQPSAQPVVGAPSGYPEVGEQGMPVFKQPKVMRVWVAPYVDAEGNLRSGEYTYFSTPGQWNYGDLKKPGAAVTGGLFGPAKPNTVAPPAANAAASAPPKPAQAAAPAGAPAASTTAASAPSVASSGGASGPAPTAAPATNSGITQPYQRLNYNQ